MGRVEVSEEGKRTSQLMQAEICRQDGYTLQQGRMREQRWADHRESNLFFTGLRQCATQVMSNWCKMLVFFTCNRDPKWRNTLFLGCVGDLYTRFWTSTESLVPTFSYLSAYSFVPGMLRQSFQTVFGFWVLHVPGCSPSKPFFVDFSISCFLTFIDLSERFSH